MTTSPREDFLLSVPMSFRQFAFYMFFSPLEMAVEKKASLAAKNWFWQSKKRPLES